MQNVMSLPYQGDPRHVLSCRNSGFHVVPKFSHTNRKALKHELSMYKYFNSK